MTNTTLPDEVLKTDVVGRVRTPLARREALLAEFARSGVSGKKFAALVGIKYQTFASWVQQRRKARGEYPPGVKQPVARARGPEALRLVEAVIESESSQGAGGGGSALGLQLPGGARVEIHDARHAALAAELLRALAAARPC